VDRFNARSDVEQTVSSTAHAAGLWPAGLILVPIVGAPKNTPAEIVERLNREINAGLASPMMKARLGDLGATVFPSSPGEFRKLIIDETEKWGKVIRAANIKLG
jgi:tripartite-type tricarboxylate transporter receptor subunit TctC